MDALIYAMGVYGLSLLVTLFVWLVIVAMRWVSREPVEAESTKPA